MKEFQLIRQIQQETCIDSPAGYDSGVRLGIGDDAAILELPVGHQLVAAADTLNAGIHFPIDTSPYDIGYKCLAVNLSDLAAMGAKPRWALLSLSLPEASSEWVDSFAAGFRSLARVHGVSLVGGDTTSGPLSISVTALGVIKPGVQLTRGGAGPGDLIVVSGTVGGAARVLELVQAGKQAEERHLLDRPQPRVELGQMLGGYASACIDISDGLLADLGHMLGASCCGARLDLDKIPGSCVLDGLEDAKRWKYQLSGGDDYELLFTLPRIHEKMMSSWSQTLGIDLNVIGEIDAGDSVSCLRPDGTEFDPQNVGFEHFAKTT